jgi:hypothetical protein
VCQHAQCGEVLKNSHEHMQGRDAAAEKWRIVGLPLNRPVSSLGWAIVAVYRQKACERIKKSLPSSVTLWPGPRRRANESDTRLIVASVLADPR